MRFKVEEKNKRIRRWGGWTYICTARVITTRVYKKLGAHPLFRREREEGCIFCSMGATCEVRIGSGEIFNDWDMEANPMGRGREPLGNIYVLCSGREENELYKIVVLRHVVGIHI